MVSYIINMKTKIDTKVAVEIPLESLRKEFGPEKGQDVLNAIIEEFIQREGTDYGAYEISMEVKKKQILNQLEKKDLVILFDSELQSVTIRSMKEWQQLIARHADAEKDQINTISD